LFSFIEKVLYKETVQVSTICHAYAIAKYDFFFRVTQSNRDEIARVVKASYDKPPATNLFSNLTPIMTEKKWRIAKTWDSFKTSLIDKGRQPNIVEAYRYCDHACARLCLEEISPNMLIIT
jgi:hypothetical protein